jgi:hypothetical protein
LDESQFFEINYSKFVAHPVESLKNAYAKLGMKGFDNALPFFTQELDRYTTYKRNLHNSDYEKSRMVDEYWGELFRKIDSPGMR